MSRARELLYIAIGSSFGLGLSPIGPGTFGALVGVAYHVAVVKLLEPSWHVPALILGLALVSWANHVLTPFAVAHWKSEDPANFVLDEVAGYLVVPILFPGGELWQVVVLGFFLFRALDIIKIPPARQIDRDMHGSWGILLDDLVSGAYAAAILHGLAFAGIIAS